MAAKKNAAKARGRSKRPSVAKAAAKAAKVAPKKAAKTSSKKVAKAAPKKVAKVAPKKVAKVAPKKVAKVVKKAPTKAAKAAAALIAKAERAATRILAQARKQAEALAAALPKKQKAAKVRKAAARLRDALGRFSPSPAAPPPKRQAKAKAKVVAKVAPKVAPKAKGKASKTSAISRGSNGRFTSALSPEERKAAKKAARRAREARAPEELPPPPPPPIRRTSPKKARKASSKKAPVSPKKASASPRIKKAISVSRDPRGKFTPVPKIVAPPKPKKAIEPDAEGFIPITQRTAKEALDAISPGRKRVRAPRKEPTPIERRDGWFLRAKKLKNRKTKNGKRVGRPPKVASPPRTSHRKWIPIPDDKVPRRPPPRREYEGQRLYDQKTADALAEWRENLDFAKSILINQGFDAHIRTYGSPENTVEADIRIILTKWQRNLPSIRAAITQIADAILTTGSEGFPRGSFISWAFQISASIPNAEDILQKYRRFHGGRIAGTYTQYIEHLATNSEIAKTVAYNILHRHGEAPEEVILRIGWDHLGRIIRAK